MISNSDHRNSLILTDLRGKLTTISNRVMNLLRSYQFQSFLFLQSQQQRENIRPVLVEKQSQNELLDSSTNWLIDTMKNLALISTEPISVQYDQASNRLKDLLIETQLKYSRIEEMNSRIHDDPSFEENRLQLISHLEDTQRNINRLINDREQIQSSVQTLDQTVVLINQNLKILRSNLEHYRVANTNTGELQVNKRKRHK